MSPEHCGMPTMTWTHGLTVRERKYVGFRQFGTCLLYKVFRHRYCPSKHKSRLDSDVELEYTSTFYNISALSQLGGIFRTRSFRCTIEV